MSKYLIEKDTLDALADAVLEKSGGTEKLSPAQMVEKIQEITIGADTSDATATAKDILAGKTAYVDGKKIEGEIANVTQATPSITVSTGGLITASATQSTGYVAAGTKSATKQLTVQAAQTITPGTTNKTIASGRYLTGSQTIKGDSNLKASNIKSGVSIFGVSGTYEGGKAAETYTLTATFADLGDEAVYTIEVTRYYDADGTAHDFISKVTEGYFSFDYASDDDVLGSHTATSVTNTSGYSGTVSASNIQLGSTALVEYTENGDIFSGSAYVIIGVDIRVDAGKVYLDVKELVYNTLDGGSTSVFSLRENTVSTNGNTIVAFDAASYGVVSAS